MNSEKSEGVAKLAREVSFTDRNARIPRTHRQRLLRNVGAELDIRHGWYGCAGKDSTGLSFESDGVVIWRE